MANKNPIKPFQKGDDPRRNTTGKNRAPISSLLKEFGNSKSIKYHIEVVNNDGSKKEIKGELKGKGKTVNQIIATRLLAKAMSGDLKAIEAVMDRTEGKPKQAIELDSMLNGTLKVGYGDPDTEQTENDD